MRRWAFVAALVFGPLVAAGLALVRRAVGADVLDQDHVVLVLAVALVSAAGRPPAGLVAAVTTGLAYDYFWVPPYYSLVVFDGSDVVTVVLLVLVGALVEQLAWWGSRQAATAVRRRDYLASLEQTAAAPAFPSPQTVHALETAVTSVLGVDRSRLVLHGPRPATLLRSDGIVVRGGHPLAVETDGLPTDDVIALPVHVPGHPYAYLALTASADLARPTLEQRRVAALLASLAGTGERLAGGPAGSGLAARPQ